ncbi:DUF3182 family protein [Pseudomonas putida]|uniref:DUF3182 family protein n=1 Tax=Pseudomonas putida group TaxID=136845 RepID=UPI00105A71BC|nr:MULTISPECIES: DUF3182 family protein [Pseudomonas putida group]MBF8747695.1 DUF3182 family protein [Pseudomonas monteilii]TDJ73039.1 DUF3182 family protein [Pseudomonas putida]
MPRSDEAKRAVVVLDSGEPTADHERATQRKLAEHLAHLLGCPYLEPTQAPRASDHYYYLAPQTLTEPQRYAALGIRSERDLFGGLVSQPFMATKSISHPRLAKGYFPPGWSDDFARQASSALLKGYTVFSKQDAREAARLLLAEGAVRVKPVRATAGRGQHVIEQLHELEPLLGDMDERQLMIWGLALEENLLDVETLSVGQVRVAGITCSYHGIQHLTHDHQGTEVYAGSELLVVRGGYEALLQLPLDEHLRLAVTQALTYEQAAQHCLPGFIASRRNYDIARGVNARGQLRSGVLEQSWRPGGASSAEVLALQAFADDPALQQVRASSHEVFGTFHLPRDSTLFYQGQDSELGQFSKYAQIHGHDHSERHR